MTAQQAMRYERRRQEQLRYERAREEVRQIILGILVVLAVVLAMALAEGGTPECELEAAEIARWEEAGVTIHGW